MESVREHAGCQPHMVSMYGNTDEGLEKIIEAIQKARARLNANVNFDLTMELMFLTMKEN